MAPRHDPTGRHKDWHLLAWQGWQAQVPVAWNPDLISGGKKDGYCRLDDAAVVRMDVKWQTVRAAQAIDAIIDSYLAQLAREHRRKKLPFPVKRDTRLARVDDPDAECFEWRSDRTVLNMAVRCKTCRRVSIVRTLFDDEPAARATAKRVLESFRDHPEGAEAPWSVYGLRCALPPAFSLEQHEFSAGRDEMVFAARNRRAVAVRIGLAEVVLKRRSLEQAIRRDPIARYWRFDGAFAKAVAGEHAALESRVRPKRIIARLWPKSPNRVRAWHCEESNALYLAGWRGPRGEEEEFETFVASFVCH